MQIRSLEDLSDKDLARLAGALVKEGCRRYAVTPRMFLQSMMDKAPVEKDDVLDVPVLDYDPEDRR